MATISAQARCWWSSKNQFEYKSLLREAFLLSAHAVNV